MEMGSIGRTKGSRSRAAAWGQWLSAAALLLIAAQTAYLLIQGESYCPTAGCKIVEEQSPLSPLLTNAGGLVFFAVLALLFLGLRRRGAGFSRDLLGPLLLAGIAAEGVLFTFQYQTGFFCLYCCTILAAVVLLNLFLGGRQAMRALFVFSAVVLASFLLTAPKGIDAAAGVRAVQQNIDAGTLARREGPAGAEIRYFFFAEDCSHCKAALTALMQDHTAGLRLNPLLPLQDLKLPRLAQQPDFNPEANRAFLTGLGIKTVPVLLVRQQDTGGMQIFLGAEQILAHLRGAPRNGGFTGQSVGQSRQSSETAGPQTDFLIPGKNGCSVDAGCSQ